MPKCSSSTRYLAPSRFSFGISLNIDVAVEKERGFASLGCIIRNSEGVVMAATISKKPCLGDPKIAEALAILKGLKMTANIVLAPLIIESDSKNVAIFFLRYF